MSQWYLSYEGERFGPYDQTRAAQIAQERPEGFAWKEGYSSWLPLRQVAELSSGGDNPAAAPPPLPVGGARADEIDYVIYGGEMQYVEIELDPSESVLAEAGAMMYKDRAVEMNTIFGDGAGQQSGLLNKFLGAGKRVLTGESLFMTLFSHSGSSGKARVAFGAPFPGNIVPVRLDQIGGSVICQKDSFLCAAKGVSVDLYLQKKMMTGLFGGEGFVMQKLVGDGWAFLHAGGTVAEKQLQPGEELHVDTGCIVGFAPTVEFDIVRAGGVKTMLFGGEGFCFAKLRGPGKVWLQSLPFSRLAGRMLMAAPGAGGSRQGEGSVLGGIGDFIDGDNR